MIGRDHNQDRAAGDSDNPGYDGIGKFGAGVLYGQRPMLAYKAVPQNLHASNKPSEHNISNMLPRIVVAQLATPRKSALTGRIVSKPLSLRPGNQSLAST